VQFRNISISLRFHWLEQNLLVFFSELDHILIRLHLHEAPLSMRSQKIERVAERPDASDEALDVEFIPQPILGFEVVPFFLCSLELLAAVAEEQADALSHFWLRAILEVTAGTESHKPRLEHLIDVVTLNVSGSSRH
jgi:hypothetical protein